MERVFLIITSAHLVLASLPGSFNDPTYQVSASISTIYPPQIDSSSDLIINAGETLNVTCRGRNPLKWEIHNHTEFDRVTQTEKVDVKDGSTMYTSVLQIVNTTYKDTTFITCFYEGTKNMDNLENATSIYVYVFDPSNLFVPPKENNPVAENFIIQPIYQHTESIIPCRPSHPDVNVTLIKDDDKIMVSSKRKSADSIQNIDVEYDPREGYHLYYPNMFYNGQFHCFGVLGNITQNISVHLLWFSDTSGPPKPHIDGYGNYIVLNDTFLLTCIVNIDPGTLLHMSWGHPNIESSRIQTSEMKAVDKVSNNGYTYREVMMNLTVRNSKISDSGNYTCHVTDHTGKTNFRQIAVKIFNTSCHLDLETEVTGTTTTLASKQEPVRFNVRFEAHPAPKIVWTKNQTQIKSGNGEKYIINVTKANTTLIIKKPNRHDSNNYTITASVCDKMREIVFPLIVWEAPTVTLESNQSFYLRKSKANITCTAEGNPIPRIEWEWQPCLDPNCRIQETRFRLVQKIKTPSVTIKDIESTDPGIRKSSLEFTPDQSGHFRCKAKNQHGNSTASIFIIASDYKEGFAIHAPDYETVETLPMTLECGVTRFNYSSLYWEWRPANDEQGEFLRVEHKKNGFKLIESPPSSSETLVQSIIVDQTDKTNSGDYMCIAINATSGKRVNRTITVDIKGIRSPEFTAGTNLNGSEISVKVDGAYQLKCNVEGTPKPRIVWLKDGKHIKEKEKTWMKFNAAKTLLNITRLRIEDSGLYACEAENIGGNASVNISIKVIGDFAIDPLLSADGENDPSWTIYLIITIVIISLILFVLVGFVVKKIKEETMNRRELEMIGQMLFEHGDPNSYNPDLPLDDQVELLPYDKRWEFPKERLKLGKTLGQGAFGRVVKAEAIGLQDGEASTTVAVKMLKQRADLNQKKALMQELKVMIHLGRHVNVVNLLAAVTKNIKKGELYVIVEFCRYGNMRHFLLRHRDNFINQIDPKTGKINQRINEFHNLDENSDSELKAIKAAANTIYGYKNSIGSGHDSDFTTIPTDMSLVTMSTSAPKSSCNSSSSSGGSDYLTSYKGETKDRPLTTCDLLCYSFQVARGMEYLSSRKLVHRDLAARNILLADDNVVKICDFGLAKDLYKYSNYKKKGDGPLPIKWMALESVRDKVFSSQSDVWSFGIVLWEFFTLGGNPYPGIEIDEEFYKKLKSGYRMDQPECATEEVYEIMQSCWRAEARDRPTFSELVESLGAQLESSIRKYYVDLNSPYMTMNDNFGNNNDYLTMDTGDDRNYVNINHVISPPLSPEYVNVSSRPRHDSINSDYLSMQSPILTNFNHTNSPFHNYTNVDKFRPNTSNALELKPLTVPESPEDPWIPRDLGNLSTNVPMTPTSDQSDYLFMGNRDSNFDKKVGSGSASSDSSSGFHSDFADNSAPPSYNAVISQDVYVV